MSVPYCRAPGHRLLRHLLLALALAPLLVSAQSSGGTYVLTRQVIAAGGERASSGTSTLTGTIGQAVTTQAGGGRYELTGGFHLPASSAAISDPLFRHGFEN